MKIYPSDNSYRTFCDLITGYRMFFVMAEAVRSGIIDLVEEGPATPLELLAKTALRPEEGERFIALLVSLGLLEKYEDLLYLSLFSRTYLSRSSATNQRHVLVFEPLLLDNWKNLGAILREGQGALVIERSADECRERLQLFQKAMAEAALVRARELWDAVTFPPERGTIIDIGAGDGTYLREFLERRPEWQGIACDLPAVCAQAATGPVPDNLTFYPCNILDREELATFVSQHGARADLLLFSNVCHCYSPAENAALLEQAGTLLKDDGFVVIHDFYRDANSCGALYDLHMLVNTWNGRSYSTAETVAMLRDAGFGQAAVVELSSFSLAVIAGRHSAYQAASSLFALKNHALSNGFFAAVELDPARIRSEAWVRAKCAYGCSQYGRRWSCPPHSMDAAGFEELLASYSRALLVTGQPPLRPFQERLLALEKEAFLGGFKKALVLSGGPCSWCESCADGHCSFPEKRRPSLEACGCDVFALANSCGIELTPLRSRDDFAQYVGLLLVD